MKNHKYLVFAIMVLFMSCDNRGLVRPPSGYSNLNFTYRIAEDYRGTGIQPNEVLVVNLDETGQVEKFPLVDGLNNVFLKKDAIQLVSFVYNSNLESSTAANVRSISTSIQLLGNITIISNGLDSLPVSPAASTYIDLGQLEQTENNFQSEADSNIIADELGVDEYLLNSAPKPVDTLQLTKKYNLESSDLHSCLG
ncbi:MAG: hypothetical protein JEY99_13240 [Spirochaetales bacterium]|nr:hypothetical protein [Spirochaetales bacterium]